MQTDVSLDLSLLEGVDCTPRCDHPNHGESNWHKDGGEQYFRVIAPCGHSRPEVIKVGCERWLMLVHEYGVRCPYCGDIQPFHAVVQIIGPVKDYK
jgi:hypothetical protein